MSYCGRVGKISKIIVDRPLLPNIVVERPVMLELLGIDA